MITDYRYTCLRYSQEVRGLKQSTWLDTVSSLLEGLKQMLFRNLNNVWMYVTRHLLTHNEPNEKN
jgi:hypothetical protein